MIAATACAYAAQAQRPLPPPFKSDSVAATEASNQQWNGLLAQRKAADEGSGAVDAKVDLSSGQELRQERIARQKTVADAARDFYAANPGDVRAPEARNVEVLALIAAVNEGDAASRERLQQTVEDIRKGNDSVAIKSKAVAAYEFTEALRSVETIERSKELTLKVARQLIVDYPAGPEGYEAMLAVARASNSQQATALAQELAVSSAPPAIKAAAERLSQRHALTGRALTEILGEAAKDIQAALPANQPVIVYAWSQSAPGSRFLGQMIQARRFVAIGVCLDDDKEAAAKVALQDGLGGEMVYDPSGLANRLLFDAPGQIYLADKTWILQDVQGGDDLEAKLRTYEFKTPAILPPQSFNSSR